ncbi:MAG: acyl-CoA dehydrogenase family protein [Leptospiraceae bacterium]|nr:acyl-CoA dehydrogenase family protein [Leptospiraceae bacterium]MCB1315312.1 acyl-CoA dehydrogenase family protein [Leptospiraceae bacterium]MCB1321218.1 acyl-CoA dehydrogenase family protein [Leptospiraceae bacterium]
MDFELSAEDREFVDQFKKLCEREIEPAAAEADENGEIPPSHFTTLGANGYLGLLHDAEYGGQGASYFQATLAQIVLAASCGSTFFTTGASAGLFGSPIADYGSPDQKRRFLPDIITGKKIGALAVTEPAAGTDVSRLTCTATETDDGFVLNGQKTYITNAPICDYALVLARLRLKNGREPGLTHFIVDANSPGVSRGRPMKKMGLRASPTGELFFEDVAVPAESLLGNPGQGFRITMEAFNRERLALAAYSVGVMEACFKDSRRYAKERKSFGRPIIKHQSVAFMLADILTKYEAAYWLLMETAWLFDRIAEHRVQGGRSGRYMHNGHPIDLTARAAEIKLMASTYAREVTNLAVQIHGGAGYMEEYRVCRLYRDIKLAEIGGGTSEIQKQIIARYETKRVPA